MVIVVRDERFSERGAFSGTGQVIARHDRGGQDGGTRVLSAELGAALSGRPVRELFSPNNVRLQYYDWSCTDNCNLPDPPQPKLFNCVASDTETVRLDPANYYTSRTYNPAPRAATCKL